MEYFAFITNHCWTSATRHAQQEAVKRLASKLDKDQSVSNWDASFPQPILKKKLGKPYRLLAEKRFLQLDTRQIVAVCFLELLTRGSAAYDRFLANSTDFWLTLPKPSDEELLHHYIGTQPGRPKLPEPSAHEYQYLYSGLEADESGTGLVFESGDWVELIRRSDRSVRLTYYYKLVLELVDAPQLGNENLARRDMAALLYRRFDPGHLYLIAPLLSTDIDLLARLDLLAQDSRARIALPEQTNADLMRQQIVQRGDFRGLPPDWSLRIVELASLLERHKHIFEASESGYGEESLLPFSRRSYPSLILADEFIWRNVEGNEEGNLALSPEEADILDSIQHAQEDKKAFPLFINGRPGSGKSTVLQYLFAEQLSSYLQSGAMPDEMNPPIYLTYGPRLLETAKKSVKTIMRCNSKQIMGTHGQIDDERFDEIADSSFEEFHRFLIRFLPPEEREQFNDELRVSFAKFRQLWLERRRDDPDANVRRLSPEVVWHVIRTYVKGMSDEVGDYLDPDAYNELPRKQKTVSIETYRLIYDRAWERWYQPYCRDNGKWDSQDLTRAVLDSQLDLSSYPGVFCDEAQDFTRNELELIFRLSLYSRRLLSPDDLRHVPFAFAGDPFQTLNPTGFDWNATQAGFHEKIVQGLDRFSNSSLEFNYRELSYNYRSTAGIARFSNLLQLLRGILFQIKNLKPQLVWFDDQDTSIPAYFDIDDPNCQNKLQEQEELVIILPCHEGEEEEYVRQDPFLSTITTPNNIRNFLSPMAAKGLEFSRVVLYHFGEQYANEYPNLLAPLEQEEAAHDPDERSLPLQYFLNRLYVGGSRAKKRLLIVDSADGIGRFWSHNRLNQFEDLIRAYDSRGHWRAEDLSWVRQGFDADWTEERDDPTYIATVLFDAGRTERDPYKLRLAAANFLRADKPNKAMECDALRFEFEGRYRDAGEIYLKLGQPTRALQCFWKSGSYQQMLATPFEGTPEHRAAIFMLSRRDLPDCTSFLDYLFNEFQMSGSARFVADPRWREVGGNALVAGLAHHLNSPANWSEVYGRLVVVRDAGLHSDQAKELGEIAYAARDYKAALMHWDTLPGRSYDRRSYNTAKAFVTDYPEKIHWLALNEAHDEVLNLVKERGVPSTDYHQEIYLAYKSVGDSRGLLDFLPFVHNEELLQDVIHAYDGTGKHALVQAAVRQLVSTWSQAGYWIRAVQFVTENKLAQRYQKDVKSQLVYEAAISEALPAETVAQRKEVEAWLKQVLIEAQWDDLLPLQTAGAAIERGGSILDSLRFYESIWLRKDIKAKSSDIRFAQERWVKAKQRQVDYSNSINRKSDANKYLEEARSRAQAWGINVNRLPEYPEVVALHSAGGSSAYLDETKKRGIRTLAKSGDYTYADIAKMMNIGEQDVADVLDSESA